MILNIFCKTVIRFNRCLYIGPYSQPSNFTDEVKVCKMNCHKNGKKRSHLPFGWSWSCGILFCFQLDQAVK